MGSSDRLLGAVLDSLCSLHLRLRSALPSLCDLQETLLSRQIYQTPEMEKLPSLSSPSENGLTSPVLQMDAQEIYPILVEHMVRTYILLPFHSISSSRVMREFDLFTRSHCLLAG